MTKLEKLKADLEHARKRQEALNLKIRELEAKHRAEENSAISEIVHAANLTPEDLKKILEAAKKGRMGLNLNISNGAENAEKERKSDNEEDKENE